MQATARKERYCEPHVQLRALYMVLLRNQDHFDEFKHLLALYHPGGVSEGGQETSAAREVRRRLNDRIERWLGMEIEELGPGQVLQWRAIVVEERFRVAPAIEQASLGGY